MQEGAFLTSLEGRGSMNQRLAKGVNRAQIRKTSAPDNQQGCARGSKVQRMHSSNGDVTLREEIRHDQGGIHWRNDEAHNDGLRGRDNGEGYSFQGHLIQQNSFRHTTQGKDTMPSKYLLDQKENLGSQGGLTRRGVSAGIDSGFRFGHPPSERNRLGAHFKELSPVCAVGNDGKIMSSRATAISAGGSRWDSFLSVTDADTNADDGLLVPSEDAFVTAL